MAAARAQQLVASVNPIDVSSVESVTILSADMLEKIPVARDLTSAAPRSPSTPTS